MKLISWNVAGRALRSAEQAEALLVEDADLIALQEVRPNAIHDWRAALAGAGLPHCEETGARLDGRQSAVLIASRWPLEVLGALAIAQPERFLSTVVAHPQRSLELHVAHVPAGMRFGLAKVEVLTAIYAALAHASPVPRILCGDFNSPMIETADGRTRTFAERHPAHGRIWEAAELSVMRDLAGFGLPDLFRELHGWQRTEHSWIHEPSGRGLRLDHVFASPALNPAGCDYLHELRTSGLSDHSAVWARWHD